MDNFLLGEKYKIIETLQSGELNNVYLAVYNDNPDSENLVINEFIDMDADNKFEEYFSPHLSDVLNTFIESFYIDSKFYIVGKLSKGFPINDYLANNNLRLSDKMYIAENLLTGLQKFNDVNPSLIYLLCNPDSVSIVGKRNVCFNLNLQTSTENIDVRTKDVIKRVGDLMCCVFANTPNATLEADKDSIPPTMASIIRKCHEGHFNSFSDIYKGFKASLLYSTFIDTTSMDKQIMKNIEKAKRKKKFGFLRGAAAALFIAAFAFGAWRLMGTDIFKKTAPASVTTEATPTPAANNSPAVKFSASINKIAVGDEVTFISEVSDPDIGDSIDSYQWTMSKNNGDSILFSNEQNAVYRFEEEGFYTVNLSVKDRSGAESNAYGISFTVHPKEDMPASDGTKSTGKGDLK